MYVCMLIVFSIESKSSITSPPIQNLLFEAKRLKEHWEVDVDWVITCGAEVTATSGNSNHNSSNDETVSPSL